jgi:hypothetical protein
MRRPWLHLASVGSIALMVTGYGLLAMEHGHGTLFTLVSIVVLILAPIWATIKATL